MVTKKNTKRNGSNREMDMDDETKSGFKKHWLLYTGLAIAGIYTMRKIPVLKSLTWPLIATAATRYFRGMQSKMQTA